MSRDAANRIRQGSEVRLRIIGMRTDSTELVSAAVRGLLIACLSVCL